MRIILNSDVLFMKRRLSDRGLASHIRSFCQDIASLGAVVVLPQTVLMENERHQLKLCQKARTELETAAATLRSYGIAVPLFDSEVLIPNGDLPGLLREVGAAVEVEPATIEDYRDAERRASFHLPPINPPSGGSDEMRDLVIWAISLRIAKRDGKAILVSMDKVHSGELGSDEATEAGLLRAETLDEARELLGKESSTGQLVRSVLATIWEELRAAGMPFPDVVPTGRFIAVHYAVSEGGYQQTTFQFAVPTEKGEFTGKASIEQLAPSRIEARFSELQLDSRPWENESMNLMVAGVLPRTTRSLDDRIHELKDAVEDEI